MNYEYAEGLFQARIIPVIDMDLIERIKNMSPFGSWKIDQDARIPLHKATYPELFFDLVFIFCIRSILPVITDAPGKAVDLYTYYTFTFTFVLMLQIWFNSTLFMNRFGTGGISDITFLFVNMFLLFIMTGAISTSWTHYYVYNTCWILIVVNTIVHWIIRYMRIDNPARQTTRDAMFAVASLGIQALLVLASNLFDHVWAQVVCFIALATGFSYWLFGGRDRLSEEGREHLGERCSLLIVLTFGEALIAFGNVATFDSDLFFSIVQFLLFVGMFLVYLNEIVNLLDLETLRGGRRYMAISAWITFCVANVTAGFEMAINGKNLLFMSGDFYYGLSITIFLASFLLFTPFNRIRYPSKRWVIARCATCLLVMAQTSVAVLAVDRLSSGAFTEIVTYVMMTITVLAVYAVLIIDRIAIRRERQREAASE